MTNPARQHRSMWRSVLFFLAALGIQRVASFCAILSSPAAHEWRPHHSRRFVHFVSYTEATAIRRRSCYRAKEAKGIRLAEKASSAKRPRMSLRINGQMDVEMPSEQTEDGAGPPTLLSRPEGSLEVCSEQASSQETQKCVKRLLKNQTSVAPRSLESVRNTLIRQEETIIFSLIERGQFLQNLDIYSDRVFRLNKTGEDDLYGRDGCFLEYMLCQTEEVHAKVRRYMNLEELAFFPMYLPEPILPPLKEPRLLAPNDVNVNQKILNRYISEVVPLVCLPGDDEQHGSAVVCDVAVLQALSRRVHLGKFVAESKFQEDSGKYQELCRAGDVRGVLAELENKPVEKKVLQRAFVKASTYGRDIDDHVTLESELDLQEHRNFKVDPHGIVKIYQEFVIPLTKDVEIMYLFQRTGYPCPSLEGLHDLHD